MQKQKYRHTIVIPTFQRANLLKDTIKSCLLQDHDNFQVLVSNNFSEDNTREVLEEFAGDPRVKVIHTDRKMSMPEHWEFVMDYVDGEYIMFLGDDDGVCPNFLTLMDQVIDKTGTNLVKFKGALYYHSDWPNEERNTFWFDSKYSGYYFEVKPDYVIDLFCEFKGYELFPNLLLTFFSYDLFMQAREKAKKMFVGAPDWTCPFLLLVQDNVKLTFIDAPLAYGGRSKKSNAAYYAEQKDKKSQSERIKEFVNELSPAIRFPYHEPLITTQGNFTPAAFSYAKHFYGERLKNFQLNKFELCKVIQADLAEEFCSNRASFHTKDELVVFKKHLDTLSPDEKNTIYSMPGFFSVTGRVLLFLKLMKRKLVTKLGLNKSNENIRTWDTKINLADSGIQDSHGLTSNFLGLIGLTEKTVKGAAVPEQYNQLTVRGQLELNKN